MRERRARTAPRPLLARPSFVIATLGVTLLLATAIVVSALSLLSGVDSEGDTASRRLQHSSVDERSRLQESPLSTSSCGLPDAVEPEAGFASDLLTVAPETTWRAVDVNLAPGSVTSGPVSLQSEGLATCFQRSTAGALFAAANFLIQSNTAELRAPVLVHMLAPGEHREQLLLESAADVDAGDPLRVQIVGFRMLRFDGTNARVDVAQRVTAAGRANVIAAVVDLVWVDGDWHIPTDSPDPVRLQAISDVSGYVRWGA